MGVGRERVVELRKGLDATVVRRRKVPELDQEESVVWWEEWRNMKGGNGTSSDYNDLRQRQV